LAGGEAHGNFSEGRLAVVSHQHGKGRTLLVGTHPSVAYYRTSSAANRAYFASVFKWLGNPKHVSLSNGAVQGRLQQGEDGLYLWLVNPTRQAQETSFALAEAYGPV